MQNNSDPERLGLFKIEALKTLTAFNKPVTAEIVNEKADLWQESLMALKTDKINAFFKFIRENKIMPTDGVIKGVLGSNLERFSRGHLEDSQYGSYNENGVYIRMGAFYTWATLPMSRWTENMKNLLEKFHDKNLNSAEAAEWDIVQETRWDALNFEKIYKRVKQ